MRTTLILASLALTLAACSPPRQEAVGSTDEKAYRPDATSSDKPLSEGGSTTQYGQTKPDPAMKGEAPGAEVGAVPPATVEAGKEAGAPPPAPPEK